MRLIDAEGKRRHVRHYLTSLRAMAESMQAKQDRLQRLRVLAEGMGWAAGERVSGGKRRDIADVQQEIDDLADEYAGDLSRYAEELAEGYRICPVDDVPKYACWLHWAEGLTWRQVANKVKYSEDHVRRDICAAGIEAVYADMPHRWRTDAPDAAE